FMDYRNADGSIAEMCGNGIRVFARYLLAAGLAAGPDLLIGTRAGVRVVREGRAGLTVEMGPATVTGTASARMGGRDLDGLVISVGNPHLACVVDEPVAGYDLSRAPELPPGEFPGGANLEVLRVTGGRHAEMRVYERGSGVTLSCGTGAVAAAVAAAVAVGEWQAGPEPAWTIDVPGGRLTVAPGAPASWPSRPALLVPPGELAGSPLREPAGAAP